MTREGALAGRWARSRQRPGRQGLSAGPCVSTPSKRTRSRAARAPDTRALPASRPRPSGLVSHDTCKPQVPP